MGSGTPMPVSFDCGGARACEYACPCHPWPEMLNDLMPEIATPTMPSAERDLQRAALRALVELCERCAAREQQIEQLYAAALEAANKESDRNNWGSEERFKNQQDAIRQKYEVRIETAESK